MIQNLQPAMETDQDLHIASHIDNAELPALIRPLMNLAQSPAEKDMLLLSLLTAAGSCMPNLYCKYGIAAKRYYPNLQLFIVGSAACGKGISARTAFRWNDRWQEEGVVKKLQHGFYKKQPASA